MDENKEEIVRNLEILLRSTRAFSDLDHLEYAKTTAGEFVLVYFKNSNNSPFTLHPNLSKDTPRHDYWVNITGDSGLAIIKDVMKHL